MGRPEIREIDGHRSLVLLSSGWRSDYSELIKRERLTGLSVRINDGDLSFLRGLEDLRVLVLNGGGATSLRDLERLVDLESLTLNTPHRPHLGLDFAAFPRLRRLGMYWNAGLESVFERRGIEELFVFGPPDRDLERFGALTSLRRLELGQGRRLTSTDGVEHLRRLEYLGLYHQSSLVTLRGFDALVALTTLAIECCKRIDEISAIGTLIRLRTLKLADCGTVASLKPLTQLQALESFYAWESTNVLDGDLSPLMRLPNLQQVAMKSRRHYSPSTNEIDASLR